MKLFRIISLGILATIIFCLKQGNAQIDKVPNLPNYDRAPYHFGFFLAVNEMFFTIDPVDNMSNIKFLPDQLPDEDFPSSIDSAFVLGVEGNSTYGFTIGIIGNLRMGKHFDLRFLPDLAFGERELVYTIARYKNSEPEITRTGENGIPPKRIYSTFVDFPLEIRYKSKRLHNTRGYIMSGIKYSIDLASEAKKNETETNNKHIRMKKHDLLFEVGVGFDFYTTYFKFGAEIKMGYSFNNILIDEDNIYTDVIDKITSKIFQLSFTFE